MPSTLDSQNSLSDVATPIVTSYRDHLSKKAEFILSTVIPEQLDCLRVILNDPKVQSRYFRTIYKLFLIELNLVIKRKCDIIPSLLLKSTKRHLKKFTRCRS